LHDGSALVMTGRGAFTLDLALLRVRTHHLVQRDEGAKGRGLRGLHPLGAVGQLQHPMHRAHGHGRRPPVTHLCQELCHAMPAAGHVTQIAHHRTGDMEP
jgi:hypothetical protein